MGVANNALMLLVAADAEVFQNRGCSP